MSRSAFRRARARWLLGAALLPCAALPVARAADAPSAALPRVSEVATDACAWPLIGSVTTTSTITSNIAETIDPGNATPPYAVAFDLALDRRVLEFAERADAASVAGTFTSHQRVVVATGASARVTVAGVLSSTPLPSDLASTPSVAVYLASTYPRVRLPFDGPAAWLEDDFMLSLTAYDAHGAPIGGLGTATDSDHNATTFDVTCTRTAGARMVALMQVGTPPPTPTPTPLPTVWPTPPPPGPELTLLRPRVLHLHAVALTRTRRHGCPRSVEIRIRPAGERSPSQTVRLPVRPAFITCTVSGAIHLGRRLAARRTLELRFRQAGVATTARIVSIA